MIKIISIYTVIKYCLFILIFSSSFILFYNQVFNNYPSDLIAHIGFIPEIINGKFAPHPMFHYLTYFFQKITTVSISLSGVFVNSFLVLLLSILVYKISFYFIKEKNKYVNLLIVLLVMYSGTFFIPGLGLTKYQYLGNGSISVWHNVTLYMVYPFAFVSFFMFFYAIDKNYNMKLLFLSLFLAILSIFAKPSFIVVFLPMIILYLIYEVYKNKFTNKNILIYAILLTLFSIIILFYQANGTYGIEEKSNVIIAPFKVWKLYSENILISIIVANLFILLFFVTNYKYLTKRSIFASIMFIGSILLFLLFAEEGPRFMHGNFGWSYILMMKLSYFSILIDYINNYKTISKFNKTLLNAALLIHLICGIYYFSIIFLGGEYV